jgi:hypothetical protein
MLTCRPQRTQIPTAELLRRLDAAAGFERDMVFGELETAVADALCPDRDEDLPVLRALRRGEWRGLELPQTLELSVPRGFAFYAADPELYRTAARRFVAEMHPSRVAVIGIRSSGTTLSRVVEAELQRLGVSTRSWTVRPTGVPGELQLNASDDLEQLWREWDGWFAVVGAGPGISGSAFGAVASFLANERIVLFPSRRAEASRLESETAREAWEHCPVYCAEFDELERFPGARDLSAGKWREIAGIWPAAHPRHERRKYLLGDRLYKFAGYGQYGRASLDRARSLAGWIPDALSLEGGFLASRWIPGHAAAPGPALVDFAARYIAAVRDRFATGSPADPRPLLEMTAENCGVVWQDPVPEGRAVVLDNRMFPHEWLETPQGFRKADALDHGDDPFFPGPHDSAWDLAGFAIEAGLDAGAQRTLLERYSTHSGDRNIAARVPFYRVAYLACRYGYCDLAVRELGDREDGHRFRRECARYLALLRAEPGIHVPAGTGRQLPSVRPAVG